MDWDCGFWCFCTNVFYGIHALMRFFTFVVAFLVLIKHSYSEESHQSFAVDLGERSFRLISLERLSIPR